MADIWDSPLWKSEFLDNAEMKKAFKALALTACTDGASPFKRKAHTFWPIALECPSLPAHIRHTLFASHLLTIIPGQWKPKDFQPFLEILVNELMSLYWMGIEANIPGHGVHNVRAMLIQWLGDYPALCSSCNVAEKAHCSACWRCKLLGRNGPGKKNAIFPGFYREVRPEHDRPRPAFVSPPHPHAPPPLIILALSFPVPLTARPLIPYPAAHHSQNCPS